MNLCPHCGIGIGAYFEHRPKCETLNKALRKAEPIDWKARAEAAEANLAEAVNEIHCCDDIPLDCSLADSIGYLQTDRQDLRNRLSEAQANLARAREIMKPGGDWRVVPAEMTDDMVSAGMVAAQLESVDKPFLWANAVRAAYAAMLSAAPLPPEQGDGNG